MQPLLLCLQICDKLRQLKLHDEEVWAREQKRKEMTGDVNAPWYIKAPFWLLCVMLDVFFANRCAACIACRAHSCHSSHVYSPVSKGCIALCLWPVSTHQGLLTRALTRHIVQQIPANSGVWVRIPAQGLASFKALGLLRINAQPSSLQDIAAVLLLRCCCCCESRPSSLLG